MDGSCSFHKVKFPRTKVVLCNYILSGIIKRKEVLVYFSLNDIMGLCKSSKEVDNTMKPKTVDKIATLKILDNVGTKLKYNIPMVASSLLLHGDNLTKDQKDAIKCIKLYSRECYNSIEVVKDDFN